nr:PREDICTED: death-associated protein-like 1 isoform X3 [Rhinolophus sinicus]
MQRKKGTAYFRQRPALVSSGDITLSYRRKKLGFESGTKKEGLELDHIYRCCRGKQTNGFKTSPRLLNSVKLASGGGRRIQHLVKMNEAFKNYSFDFFWQ